MRLLRLPLLWAALLLPGLAQAGNPCPIDFTFYDLGAPNWLDREKLLDGLTSKDSWLGMSYKTHSTPGVRITNVSSGSPVAKAGLKVGDVLLTANGKPLKTFKDLSAVMDTTQPGSTLNISVSRGGKVEKKTLTLSRQDPILGALIRHASKQDCASVTRGDSDGEWAAKAKAAVFAKNRRFRCDDAADKLYGSNGIPGPGDIFLVRGSKRVLIANAGYETVCVRAAEYDGAKLTPAKVANLYRKLTQSYVDDRYANP